jgi:hypothetical protein
MRRLAVSLLAFSLVIATGCSDDDGDDDAGAGATTTAPEGDGAGANATLPDDCRNRLNLVGEEDEGLPDGPFGTQLTVSEGGDGQAAPETLQIAAFGGYAPETPAIPTGDPTVPAEGRALVVTLEADEAIAGDQTFTTEGVEGEAGDGTATIALWTSDGEVEVGAATVTVTAMTDSRVCVGIEPVEGAGGVTGTLKPQRLEGGEF